MTAVRIAIAGISHETNTYCKDLTPKDAFYVYRGERMLRTSGQQSDLGGAIDACLELDVEVVPIVFAGAQPSGTIEREAYDAFKEEILAGLAAQKPLDACVLLLHGAGVVDGIEDLEGDLTQAVRELLADIPITASFDLHGNVTQRMADNLNGVFPCRQYPHIDLHEQAAGAVEHAVELARTGQRSVCLVETLPVLLPTTTTFEGVAQDFLEQVRTVAEASECVDIGWFHGFPYTDVGHVGSFLVATCAPEAAAGARVLLEELGGRLWSLREDFLPRSLSGAEAVAAAAASREYPVVINETSDNCGGGAPGYGTHLLQAMLDAKLGADACFAFIVDPDTVSRAELAGVGSTVDVRLGGADDDDLHGAPIETTAHVKALHDGRLTMQAMFKGAPLNVGPLARLVIDGMDVVVGSRRSQTFDEEPFRCVGINVRDYKYVALKSSNHFRAGFKDIAARIVTADTPGLSTLDVTVFPRQRTSRKLWPIDAQASYP